MYTLTSEYFIDTVLGSRRIANLTLVEVLDLFRAYTNHDTDMRGVREDADSLIDEHLQRA